MCHIAYDEPTGHELAGKLNGKPAGQGRLTAKCPSHSDRRPSLSIGVGRDGKTLFHCFVCTQEQVLDALRGLGFWPQRHGRSRSPHRRHQMRQTRRYPGGDQELLRRGDVAQSLWQLSLDGRGTLAETYLAYRSIHLEHWPATIRFHAGLKHPSGDVWPAMVALVTRGSDGMPLGVHRTFLNRDGVGKAPVDPQKMMLGPCRGGAIRLADPDDVLMVAEGIETALAAMLATGQPAWAALSTSGLRTLDLPHDVRDVIVLAHGDEAGEAAARDCAWRWKHEGRRVRIARPPHGLDFNDMLMGRALCIEESAQ
jgi:putative DNA primase/helicase